MHYFSLFCLPHFRGVIYPSSEHTQTAEPFAGCSVVSYLAPIRRYGYSDCTGQKWQALTRTVSPQAMHLDAITDGRILPFSSFFALCFCFFKPLSDSPVRLCTRLSIRTLIRSEMDNSYGTLSALWSVLADANIHTHSFSASTPLQSVTAVCVPACLPACEQGKLSIGAEWQSIYYRFDCLRSELPFSSLILTAAAVQQTTQVSQFWVDTWRPRLRKLTVLKLH